MAARPLLHCVFFFGAQVRSGQIALPLVYEKPPGMENVGTRLIDLELWLRDQFSIAQGLSVFAVAPAEELYSPPYPLVLINTIAQRLYETFEPERTPVLNLALVVREMALLRQPVLRGESAPEDSPYAPISAAHLSLPEDCLERQVARMRFVRNMTGYGFARLTVTPEQAHIPQKAFRDVRMWLIEQLALPAKERWSDRVDARAPEDATEEEPVDSMHKTHPMVSKGRYVGFSGDRNREYLQLRQPIASSGTVWPPAYFATDESKTFASEMLTLLGLLDDIGRDCMRAICDVVGLDPHWVIDELLDDRTAPPATEEAAADLPKDKSYQYGASVLRIYNYRNKKAAGEDSKTPLDPNDELCGVHADLGLVTVSPVATVPGLQMWNLERMLWTDVEEDATELHFSVFAGETLGFLTNGLIKAPLHRVPAMCVDGEDNRRMSMPYFLRVRPEKCLNPTAEPSAQITCRDFMEDIVFKKRPWRPRKHKHSPPPDY